MSVLRAMCGVIYVYTDIWLCVELLKCVWCVCKLWCAGVWHL